MIYFIESVTTYATSGKTRKGAVIQAAAARFEHNLLADGDALNALVAQLRILVNVCNDSFRGSELHLSWHRDGDSGQISVHPRQTGSESYIVTIHYAPVVDRISFFQIRDRISESVRRSAPDIYSRHIDAAYSIDRKGGAR